MKKFFFAGLALLFVFSGFGQSGGNTESRKLSDFHGIQVSGGIDLYLSSGGESVSVSASSVEVRNHIKTEVVNGILRIYMDESWSESRHDDAKMKAYVSIPDLKSLYASGGGDIVIKNIISSDELRIGLSGGGTLKGKLNANHLVINQSGGSELDLSGTVKNLDLNASGGGSLGGYDLVTDYASIHASGGSDTRITVNKELRAVLSGGGSVNYKGSASVKEIKSSGGGTVTHKD